MIEYNNIILTLIFIALIILISYVKKNTDSNNKLTLVISECKKLIVSDVSILKSVKLQMKDIREYVNKLNLKIKNNEAFK